MLWLGAATSYGSYGARHGTCPTLGVGAWKGWVGRGAHPVPTPGIADTCRRGRGGLWGPQVLVHPGDISIKIHISEEGQGCGAHRP